MGKGHHIIIDCSNADFKMCMDDKKMLNIISESAEQAGATVISTVRYKFGGESPPGFACLVMLDESHCSAHSYANEGLIAFDIFTCGKTDPEYVWFLIKEKLKFDDKVNIEIRKLDRFVI
mgnify:CR=1 FL=1